MPNISGTSGVLRDARMIIGASASIDEFARVAASATHSLAGEVFSFADPHAVDAVRGALSRGVAAHLHGDPEWARLGRVVDLSDLGSFRLTLHGTEPMKLHAKSLARDGVEAWVGTAAPIERMREMGSIDVSFTFGGDAARAVEALATSAGTLKRKPIQLAAQGAAELGIVVNDPAFGVHHLTSSINALIDDAQHWIFIGTKDVRDAGVIKRLKAAQDRGVEVYMEVTSRVRDKDLQAVRDAGIEINRYTEELGRLHGNIVVADGTKAYVGTAMLTPRGLGTSKSARPSREMGVLIDDLQQIRTLLGAVADTGESQLAGFLRRFADYRW